MGSNIGLISQCKCSFEITGSGLYSGGVVGVNWGHVVDSYSEGENLCLADHIGGLVGSVEQGQIERCYSVVGIVGLRVYVGGLVGWSYDPVQVISCFWDMDTSSQRFSYGGQGLSKIDMSNWLTYLGAGWDLLGESINGTEEIWVSDSGDYPRLWWEKLQQY